jgi:hypothetical protein
MSVMRVIVAGAGARDAKGHSLAEMDGKIDDNSVIRRSGAATGC